MLHKLQILNFILTSLCRRFMLQLFRLYIFLNLPWIVIIFSVYIILQTTEFKFAKKKNRIVQFWFCNFCCFTWNICKEFYSLQNTKDLYANECNVKVNVDKICVSFFWLWWFNQKIKIIAALWLVKGKTIKYQTNK